MILRSSPVLILIAVLPLVAACAGKASPSQARGPAASPAPEVGMLSYFVRMGGHEELLGTLSADGIVARNPALPTGDADADGEALSKRLSVRLDTDGRPMAPASPSPPGQPSITWSLRDDGTVTWRVAPPAGMDHPPVVFQRGFRVLADGRAFLPAFGISYVLRDDGTVVQRFRDGREEIEPRWRVEGPVGANKRRAMVALVILDDFFDTGGGPVN